MGSRVGNILAFLMLAALLYGTIARNEVWRKPVLLAQDTATKSPGKPRARARYGQELAKVGRYGEALDEYRAVYQFSLRNDLSEKDREMARLNAQVNSAQILMKTGREAEAEALLRNAWLESPSHPGLAVGLTYFALSHGRYNEAVAVATDGITGLHVYPNMETFFAGKLYLNRGAAYLASGNCKAALLDFAEARKWPDIPETPTCKEQIMSRNQIVVNPSAHRVAALEKKPAPINTRTCLWHPNKPPIFVEGIGETDEERVKSIKEIIKDKKRSGYIEERPHGQHPHSNDDHRIEMQQREAEKGNKEAREALKAKAMVHAPRVSSKTEEELALENDLLRERLAELEKGQKGA